MLDFSSQQLVPTPTHCAAPFSKPDQVDPAHLPNLVPLVVVDVRTEVGHASLSLLQSLCCWHARQGHHLTALAGGCQGRSF